LSGQRAPITRIFSKLHGRILTPDGLRVVCAGFDNDPEMIGIHMLEMLNKFRNEGIVE
jgi:hypothetical protein